MTEAANLLGESFAKAVASAVKEALRSEVVPEVLAQLEGYIKAREAGEAKAEAGPQPDRYVSVSELCKRLNLCRTTILKRERTGKIPRRMTFPDGRSGWTARAIDEWFDQATDRVPDPFANARLASRIAH